MQRNLPKLALLILFALIGIMLLLVLFLKIIAQTKTTTTERVIVNSSIFPYTAKSTPALEKELDHLGFWIKNTRFSTTAPKKLTINISYIGKDSLGTSSYVQTDKEGNWLVSGKRELDSSEQPVINIFVSNKVFESKDPAIWLDSVFWNVYYLLTIGPKDSNAYTFIKQEMDKDNYFNLSK